MALNPMLMLAWDLVQTPEQQKAWPAAAAGWIKSMLAADGALEYRGYRTANGASPQTVVFVEYSTVQAAMAAAASETLARVTGEIRTMGGSNIQLSVLGASPVTPEPIRKS